MRKLLIFFGIFILSQNIGLAGEHAVFISPVTSYNTYTDELMEGDTLEFVVKRDVISGKNVLVKKGDKVFGLLTSRKDNGFIGLTASLFVEQIHLENGTSLKGVLLEKGNTHSQIFEFIPLPNLLARPIRGGEADITPKKEYTFILND